MIRQFLFRKQANIKQLLFLHYEVVLNLVFSSLTNQLQKFIRVAAKYVLYPVSVFYVTNYTFTF